MKYYWFIPFAGLFFIEEQADWVYRFSDVKASKKAFLIVGLNMIFQAFCIALLSYNLIFSY